MWRGPKENVAYEFVFTSPAVYSLVRRNLMVFEMIQFLKQNDDNKKKMANFSFF